MKIAVFDSGIGGLSVLHQAMKRLPNEAFLYYADEDHVPYGEKTREQIIEYSEEAVKFLIDKGADAIVIACNTATSAAAAVLRSRYSLPIIGMEPAVKKALDLDPVHRVFVAATPVTIHGDKLKILMEHYDNHHLVDLLPLPKLVRFAEKGIFGGDDVKKYLEEQLKDFDLSKYSALVLGCTHFNLFKAQLRELLPSNMSFVDGNKGTVNQLIRKLGETGAPSEKEPSLHLFSSGREITDEAEKEKIRMILAHLEKMYPIE